MDNICFTGLVIHNLNTVIFSYFLGVLDARGKTSAVFYTLGPLPPGMAGITMTFAYTIHGPIWDYASNAVDIAIVP